MFSLDYTHFIETIPETIYRQLNAVKTTFLFVIFFPSPMLFLKIILCFFSLTSKLCIKAFNTKIISELCL